MTRPDVDAAVKKVGKFGVGREVKMLPSLLADDETVDMIISGSLQNKNGLVVLTDKRLFFFHASWASQRTEEQFDLSHISSVAYNTKNGLTGTLTISKSGGSAEFKNVPNIKHNNIAEAIRLRVAEVNAPKPAAAEQPGGNDLAELIAKLAALRDAGVLTEDEFAIKKADLLARM